MPLVRYGEGTFREIAVARATFEPDSVASSDVSERQHRAAYADHVFNEAPKILADHDGELAKLHMRELLRRSFDGTLPADEANPYGWAIRCLTEVGVIEPARD